MSGKPIVIEWEGRQRVRRDVVSEMSGAGVPIAEIARRLGVSYQTVYIILRQPAANRTANAPERRVARREVVHAPHEVDAILVGCVSQKGGVAAPAKELYRSELFRRRRLFAEQSGRAWWILSAEYGLVEPETIIEPYDTRIAALSLAARHELAARVADDLETALGDLQGKRIEIHAGDEYVLAVGPALRKRGGEIIRPLQGLRIGEQLGWYGQALGLGVGKTLVAHAPEELTKRIRPSRGLGRRLTDLFMGKALDLSNRTGAPPAGWDGMPEVVAVRRLREIGADDQAVRRFLTFNAAMDRARDADRLAAAGVRLFRDQPWAFDPVEVANRPARALADVLRRFGVSQRHSVDAYGWRLLAETLADASLAPAVRGAVFDGRSDAHSLQKELGLTTAAGTPLFPLLSGPKVGPPWIRLMAYPGGATITSLDVVPVAVDVQVRKVTEYLAVTDTGGLPLDEVRPVIQEAWRRDVLDHGAAGPAGLANTPGALDPALWFYGKWGCSFCQRATQKSPISPLCAECRFPDAGA